LLGSAEVIMLVRKQVTVNVPLMTEEKNYQIGWSSIAVPA